MARSSSSSSPTVIAYPKGATSYAERPAAVLAVADALVRLVNEVKPGYARESEESLRRRGRNRKATAIEVRAPWHDALVEDDEVRGTDAIRVRLMHGDRESRL